MDFIEYIIECEKNEVFDLIESFNEEESDELFFLSRRRKY